MRFLLCQSRKLKTVFIESDFLIGRNSHSNFLVRNLRDNRREQVRRRWYIRQSHRNGVGTIFFIGNVYMSRRPPIAVSSIVINKVSTHTFPSGFLICGANGRVHIKT